MYRIIGIDGRQYGPVTAEQVRDWIIAGRANGMTLGQAEGSTEWKPLTSFAEFAGTIGAKAASANQPPFVSQPAMSPVASKASSKIAAGICGILIGSFGVHKFILGYTGAGLIMLLVTVLTCGLGAVVMGVIGLIEGIIYLSKSDEEFVRVYVDGRKEWL
ncbi:MAG: NINE protein [Verrucomicrobia bacterium]|nr:NINE protein [Verrucomicrobiota bacterium]